MALVGVILLGVVLLLTVAYLFLRERHSFWRRRGFPCKPNPSLLFGQMEGNGSTKHAAYVTQEIYNYAKEQGERYVGYSFFFMPILMVCDIELVKTILVKDFTVFHDRGIYSNSRVDPLSGNLFALEGHEWREMRQKLTPTFSSGRMKQMFGTMLQVAEELHKHMLANIDREIEMKDVLARFTTDVIGTCAFGIECNTLDNPDSEFLKYGKRVFEHRLVAMLKMTFAMLFKGTATKLGVKVTDDDLEQFFLNLVHETVEYRERNDVQRNDFLNLLLQIKNKGCLAEQDGGHTGPSGVGMTMNELAAQVFIFFVAGFETSSTVMNFCLYELAKNPDVQERLREEINRAIETNDGKLTYEVVMDQEYLGQVVNETLRKYPPLETTLRMTAQDYTIPGTDHVIPRNVGVQVPVFGIHRDPEHYPDPERFDPGRFSADECQKRPAYTFLPFGEGPRMCIGMRFGMMQVKVGLVTLLRSFRFFPSAQTPERIVFDPKSFILSPIGGNYLTVEKL
ncbi:probable cytochrome P450 6a14 [Anopheles marshallii]|uniref:probable cytochrome P450 6a14 n=1 Tax=Anopheles marshallii TaxID=1521116 RepID=UPI00237B2E90|nr:probable cytochrome P450 6a14 [Anopheles marshallii]